MTRSPRLTRAALTFLLFGTLTALLPSQDMTALADVACTQNPQYQLRLTSSFSDTRIPDSTTTLTIAHSASTPLTLGAAVSSDGGKTFQKATDGNFKARTLTYTLSNLGTSGTFSMGGDSSKNITIPGQTSLYSLDPTLYRTGLYASQAGMSGTITVNFHVGQISMVDSRALASN